MKILRHIMMALPLLLWASCSKQEIAVPQTPVSICFNVNTAGETKAAGAENVNRCVFQVWMQEGESYRLYNSTVMSDFTPGNSLSVSLMPHEHYRFAAWVDHSGCYNVENGIVTLNQTSTIDAQCYDAFYASTELDITTGETVAPIDLVATRPFACLRLQAEDLSSFTVSEVSLGYTAPQSMSLLTGEVGAESLIQTVSRPVFDATSGTLAMTYIFVADEDTQSITLNCMRNGESFTRTFDLIPLRRNYTTNINGNLLTTN